MIAWHEICGVGGAILIVGSYLLLQLGRWRAERLAYPLTNALGASLVLVSLSFDFNLAAALLEGFWVLISLIGIFRWWRRLREQPGESAF